MFFMVTYSNCLRVDDHSDMAVTTTCKVRKASEHQRTIERERERETI